MTDIDAITKEIDEVTGLIRAYLVAVTQSLLIELRIPFCIERC